MALPESATAFMSSLIDRARRLKKKIVFPEGADPRVLAAAERLAREGLVQPILIGPKPATPPGGITFVNPADSERLRNYAQIYYERRRAKGITLIEAEAKARTPIYFADLMVAAGDADGCVGGVVVTTADMVRAALHCVGVKPGVRIVSSISLMGVRNREFGYKGMLAFADCAVVIEPTPVELAEIAITTAESTRTLLQTEPIVALLSFSTKGSGRHPHVDKVVEAMKILRERAPQLNVDGELQADAALVASVGQSKAPGSTVAGQANTLIFPNLASANIGYKLVERLGEAASIGPFLQGLTKPINDLSRGCSAEDIYNTAVITSLQ